MSKTKSDPLLVRARRLYADHRARAKKDGVTLNYTLSDIRELLEKSPKCFYCQTPLGFDLQVDHQVPIARNGKHELANLAVCCGRCNRLKGKLAVWEFIGLLNFLTSTSVPARADIELRMLAGAARYGPRYAEAKRRKKL